MKNTLIVLLTLLLLLLQGCDAKKPNKKLRIAVTNWVGYSPILYAKEKGWFEDTSIKIVYATSLQESLSYYRANLVDGFASTQYEALISGNPKLRHFMPLDRSKGGDALLSNLPLEHLLHSRSIDVYLEIESINTLLFEEFIEQYALQDANYRLFNISQLSMKELEYDLNRTKLLITYEPYATLLRQKGFHEVASTKESSLLVLDSLYINQSAYRDHEKALQQLQKIIQRAYQELQSNPHAYYQTLQKYFDGMSQEEFMETLQSIEWLIGQPRELYQKMVKGHKVLPLQG